MSLAPAPLFRRTLSTTLRYLQPHLVTHTHKFHVVNTTGPTILGLPTCTEMKLVTLNHSLSKEQPQPAGTSPAQVPQDARRQKQPYSLSLSYQS